MTTTNKKTYSIPNITTGKNPYAWTSVDKNINNWTWHTISATTIPNNSNTIISKKAVLYRRPSTGESLAKRPLSERDKKWLKKIYNGEPLGNLPTTIKEKLVAKKLIIVKITLTDEGKREGFLHAMTKES